MPTCRIFVHALSVSLAVIACAVAHAESVPSVSHCVLQRTGDHFAGSCGALFDQTPAMTLKPAAAITTGMWRADIHPSAVWVGDMTDKGYPNAALEAEVYPGGWGILRTEYGWFPITHLVVASTLTFDLDASHEIRPSPLDQKIVREAAHLLSTSATWNRADTRDCPAGATTWSIYCALIKATIDVTGGSHHRRPALETVRLIVDERTATRNYHHRLMDYNNDPTTTLADVQSLFNEALAQMEKPTASP